MRKISGYSANHIVVDYVVPLVIISLAIFLHLAFQQQIIAGEGYGWDGLEYKKLYQYFSGADVSEIRYPFCNRIGTPALASLLSLPAISDAFKFVNLLFAVVFSFTTYLIARRLNYNLIGSLFALFMTIVPFFSPVRFIPFYPVYTDPAFLAILSLSMLAFVSRQYVLVFFLLAITFLFREASLYVLLLLGIVILRQEGPSKKLLMALAAALLFIIIIKVFIIYQFDCSGSQIKTALSWARKGLTDPVRFVNSIAAILMTAAPIFFIKSMASLSHIEKISLVGFLLAAVMSFLGGSDVTRIFYSFLPLYIFLIVRAVSENGGVFLFFCLLGYIITNRFGQKILEPLNYQPAKDESGLFWQFPDHARPEVGITIIIVWGVIFAVYARFFKGRAKLY